MRPVHSPRTGTGMPFLIVGTVLLVLGVLVSCGASDGMDPGTAAIGGLMAALGSAAVAVGFIVGLVHKIELRLIDIQEDARARGKGEPDPES